MRVINNTIVCSIYHEEEAAQARALKIARCTKTAVEVRSRNYDGFGREQRWTSYEYHIQPDGRITDPVGRPRHSSGRNSVGQDPQ